MDLTDEQAQKWLDSQAKLEKQEKELREKAADYAKRKLLPAKLKSVSPVFAKQRLNPQDVKVIFHPVDYVAFDGMNLKDRVDRVLFFDRIHKSQLHRRTQDSLQDTIDAEKYEWVTIRTDENGGVFLESLLRTRLDEKPHHTSSYFSSVIICQPQLLPL